MPSFVQILDKILISSRKYVLPNSTRRFKDEWSCCSSCKQEDHCMQMRRKNFMILSRESRYTSPEVAASARVGMRRRCSDRACPRLIRAGSRPHARPSVCPACSRCEHLNHAMGKYSSDPCFRCNPHFRSHPVCLHPQCYIQRKYM